MSSEKCGVVDKRGIVTGRLQYYGVSRFDVDEEYLTKFIVRSMYDYKDDIELDTYIAHIIASMVFKHPDYDKFATRILYGTIVSQCQLTFTRAMLKVERLLDPRFMRCVKDNSEFLDGLMDNCPTYDYTYFGLYTFRHQFLLCDIDGSPVEIPQYTLLRLAVWLNLDISTGDLNMKGTRKLFNALVRGYCTHATPQMRMAGTRKPQMASCFLINVKEDTAEETSDLAHDIRLFSEYGGGIGVNINCIRGKGAVLDFGGKSGGLVPLIRNIQNNVCPHGLSKRPSSCAIYIEPWHLDVMNFLQMKTNTGHESNKARDLFYALWVPDLFMKRISTGEKWTLMCPGTFPGLDSVFGLEFEKKYTDYEKEIETCLESETCKGSCRFSKMIHKPWKIVDARALWETVLMSQLETGGPYILFKDNVNRKSNHKHAGTIKGGNLCAEIVQYSSGDETAVCNLASINLNRMLDVSEKGRIQFNFERLGRVAKILTRALDKAIDNTDYLSRKAELSNKRFRPIGIGVQGLADVFMKLSMPFGCNESKRLNYQIFECIYYHALRASNRAVVKYGLSPFETFKHSPFARGLTQRDQWFTFNGTGKFLDDVDDDAIDISHRYPYTDIDQVRVNCKGFSLISDKKWKELSLSMTRGMRNSMLTAAMPTATTSQLLGSTECFEPLTSNVYTRKVLLGEFQVVNHVLMKLLIERGLWNEDTRRHLIENDGSVANLDCLTDHEKRVFRTVNEIPKITNVLMALGRGQFIDQSQSMNIYSNNHNIDENSNIIFLGWSGGLNTGAYYTRTSLKVYKYTLISKPLECIGCSA